MSVEEKCSTHQRRRRALSVDEQCQLLARHGIKFEQCCREDAKHFLKDNTYFFKLKAFDNNFVRDDKGTYLNLDFAYLKDLSTIDFEFRVLILRMTGDIEHALRVRFNNLLSRVNEDGYQVIRDYEDEQAKYYEKNGRIYDSDSCYQQSVYTKGMIDKFLKDKPVWLFLETCAFSNLIRCYRSFLTHRRFQDVTYSLLYGVRLLRNAASHHNCLLIPSQEDIKRTEDLDKLLKVFLPDSKESAKTFKLAETDPLIHDFACVLIAHINLVQSIGMRSGVVKQIELFIKRMRRHYDWYHNSERVHDHLTQQFDSIELLLTRAIEFNQMRDDEVLSEYQKDLLRQPYRRPVRRGPRRASKRARERQQPPAQNVALYSAKGTELKQG